ncbi:hypothetical protein [Paenibacillus profundus]|nr:hypothetical protein [Paenibacillus profundus]
MGGQASINDSWAVLASKVRAIATGPKHGFLFHDKYIMHPQQPVLNSIALATRYVSHTCIAKIDPESGRLQLKAVNDNEPSRASMMGQKSVDLTGAKQLVLHIRCDFKDGSNGMLVTVGVAQQYTNDSRVLYDKFYAEEVFLGIQQSFYITVDTVNLTGKYFVGMDVRNLGTKKGADWTVLSIALLS